LRVAEPEPDPVGTIFIFGTPAPELEPYSEYGSGSGYKEMKPKTQKNLLKFNNFFFM
jgi:hypothetical protein